MNSYLLHLALLLSVPWTLLLSHILSRWQRNTVLTSKGKLHITFHPKWTRYYSFIISMLMYVCAYVYGCTCPCVCGGQRLVLVVSRQLFYLPFSLHKPKDYCFSQSELPLPGHACLQLCHHWGYRRIQSLTFCFICMRAVNQYLCPHTCTASTNQAISPNHSLCFL